MSFFASFAPQIATSIIGGALGGGSARSDRRALNAANMANNMGYFDARPYITDLYKSGRDAKDAAIDAGTYQGDTYAGLNPFQTTGFNYLGNAATDMMGMGRNLMDLSGGFGQNYSDLYNQASQDRLGNAMNYATENVEPLLTAAMRDPYRQLTENTLTGINQGASATGNMNSSRAGVQEALANRAYDDRSADTAASLMDSLIGRSLSAQDQQFGDQLAANDALKSTFGIGMGLPSAVAGMLTDAGAGFQVDDQNRMTDAKNRYDENRMDTLNILGDYNNSILNRAPTSPSYATTPNYFNPMMGALGGASSGFGMGGSGSFGDFFSGLFNPTARNYMSYANANN